MPEAITLLHHVVQMHEYKFVNFYSHMLFFVADDVGWL